MNDKDKKTMTNENTVDRRRFLMAAGAAVAGTGAAGALPRSASAESTLTIRKKWL